MGDFRPADGRASIDPWLLRHLLLSIDDRPRSRRDRRELEESVRRTVAVLQAVPSPEPFAPTDIARPEGGVCVGVPLWVFETNSWVLAPAGPDGDCIVVDVPPAPGRLIAELERHRLRVSAVFLTHAHLDHVGGVPELLAAVDHPVPVFVHADDADQVAEPLGVDALMARALRLDAPAVETLHALDDGEHVVAAGVSVVVMHAPGHTPGTTCYLVRTGRSTLLFTGDQLFAAGIGRTDLAGASGARMLASMAPVIDPLDDDVVILPGHGEAATLGAARRTNPFLAASYSAAEDEA